MIGNERASVRQSVASTRSPGRLTACERECEMNFGYGRRAWSLTPALRRVGTDRRCPVNREVFGAEGDQAVMAVSSSTSSVVASTARALLRAL